MDLFDHIMELSRYGYFCSQILAILGLELAGEQNPKLVQAMGGLDGGVGYSRNNCGCMTGGACMLSYFTGKPDDLEVESLNHKPALAEFTQWFQDEMTADYGGINCEDIVGTNPAKRVEYCPQIIAACYTRCMEILEEKGLL